MTQPSLHRLVAGLSTQQKAELLTGKTAWRLYAAPEIGLREMVVSDGPAGVRGTGETQGETSLSFSSPSALSATWDPDLARRIGREFAIEARRHGVDVVLAPIVNLQRTPVGGRHFENLSEDPVLAGDIAVAFIEGCQDAGVGVCVKHFIGNESETQRTEYIATIDETTLREVYLAPFERCCRDAHAWSIMASYNLVDDGVELAPAVGHHHLLTDVLKNEWGYDGLVVSDWTAAKTALGPALGGLDLVMPGPLGPWSHGVLARLVDDGEVPVELLDDKVERMLLLASRVGALADAVPARVSAVAEPAELDLLRELAGSSVVVLKDDDHALPLARAPKSIALIGPNATQIYAQGGGSAHVNPASVVSPAQALTEVFPGVEIVLEQGATSPLRPARLEPGIASHTHLTVTDQAGETLIDKDIDTVENGVRDLPETGRWARLTMDIELAEPGDHWLGLGTVGAFVLSFDGVEVARNDEHATRDVFIDSSINLPPAFGATVTVGAAPRTIRFQADVEVMHDPNWDGSFTSIVPHHEVPQPDAAAKIAAAVAAARRADEVVVIVGTNAHVESEGWDRRDLDLPGDQNELVSAILAVRPDAVVAVNAGSPVILPWLDKARTVIWAWFPGQMGGYGIADVLSGRTEPAGRLPWTLPGSYGDVPVPNGQPDADMRIRYTEGRDVGYRGWLRLGRVPARPFGFGLGWTTWSYDDAALTATDDGFAVTVRVANTGPRAGRETVQVYLSDPSDPKRPPRWLAGSAGVTVPAGEHRQVTVPVSSRSIRTWDAEQGGWTRPATTYTILVAHDLDDVRAEIAWADSGSPDVQAF
jgi:beta-glucosidase